MSLGNLTLMQIEGKAAEYYKRHRPAKSEWKSIDDLAPLLYEYSHRLRAKDYKEAFRILDLIDVGYLNRWGHYKLLISMRSNLTGKLPPNLDCVNYNRMGRAAHNLAEYERALEFYAQALSLAQHINDYELISQQYGAIGKSRFALGKYAAARLDYLEALNAARLGNHKIGIAIQQENIGYLYAELGDYGSAFKLFERTLDLVNRQITQINKVSAEGAWQHLRSILLLDIGNVYQNLGQYAQASAKLAESTEARSRARDDKRGDSIHLSRVGRALHEQGQYDEAIAAFEEALLIDKEINSVPGEIHNYAGLASVYLARGMFEQSLEFVQRSLQLADRVKSTWHLQRQGTLQAEIYLALDRKQDAYDAIKKARRYDSPGNNHRAVLINSIVLLLLNSPKAKGQFNQASKEALHLLKQTEMLFAARYTNAIAMYGRAILSPPENRNALILASLREFTLAYSNCSAKGVVENAVSLLRYIQPYDPVLLFQEIMNILKLK